MFCLRSWIPILFFLFQKASPAYLVLFLSATYFLNRPCVYCSLLLAVLVIALFDFRADWFETPASQLAASIATNETNHSSSLRDSVLESASIVASGFNGTAAALMEAAAAQVTPRPSSRSTWISFPFDWMKGVISKGELRIDCINTVIRL